MKTYLDELFGLNKKIAIVTGGNRGIGQTIAVGLAMAGATVVILSRTSAKDTIHLVEAAGGECDWFQCDVIDESAVNKVISEIVDKYGKIDILFNNAGICMHQTSFEATIEEFRQVIDINLVGEFIVARAVAKVMIEKKTFGSIVNMASISGTIVNVPQMQCSYNSSKAAVMHMTKSLAVELAEYSIRVNSLSPGYIATPMSTDTPQELKDAWMPKIPMKRMADPKELIPAVLYLVSDSSKYTTGSDIIVDGGYTLI